MAEPYTPTPWKFRPADENGADMGGFETVDGTPVCNFGNGEQYYPTEGEPPCWADAHFIVHAVNSHASLLYTIKELVEALENIEKDCEADYPPSHGAIKHAARSALTRAKSLMEQKPTQPQPDSGRPSIPEQAYGEGEL